MRINVIGTGKVGETLMRRIVEADGLTLGSVFNRSADRAEGVTRRINAGQVSLTVEGLAPAELWFLTVPDDRIAETAQALARSGHAPAMVAHCSGFLSSEVLAPLSDLGWKTASCHPVRSFADPVLAAKGFAGTYCAIEGEASAALSSFVSTIGGVPFGVDPARKALYHAAAVFSNNFSTMLQAVALEAYADSGVPEHVAKALCKTLLDGAAENVAQLGPREALTGPAARGDRVVLDQQGSAVADWSADAGVLYAVASRMAERLKRLGRAS